MGVIDQLKAGLKAGFTAGREAFIKDAKEEEELNAFKSSVVNDSLDVQDTIVKEEDGLEKNKTKDDFSLEKKANRTTNERKSEKVAETFESIYNDYKSKEIGNDIKNELQKLVKRSKEYESGAFIILVVGAVKSGKSTLVNMLAHDYVSPTDKLECTVRPSIISNEDVDEKGKITVYSSVNPEDNRDNMDLIIDYLRNPENSDISQKITSKVYPLDEEHNNIDNIIFPSYKKSSNDPTLITSITTKNSKLLKTEDGKKVYLVDMPGFDGNEANMDNDPRYDVISQRVDLVLFVHSSSSAFSLKVSQYLDLLKKLNGAVPVFLVCNIFDSAYWRSENQKEKDLTKQKDKAKDEIREKGFRLDDNNICMINLGKASDYRGKGYNDSYKDDLEKSEEDLEKLENSLITNFTKKLKEHQVDNSLKRVSSLNKSTQNIIQNRIETLESLQRNSTLVNNTINEKISGFDVVEEDLSKFYDKVFDKKIVDIFDNFKKIRIGDYLAKKDCKEMLDNLMTEYIAAVNKQMLSNSVTLVNKYKVNISEIQEEIRKTIPDFQIDNSVISNIKLGDIVEYNEKLRNQIENKMDNSKRSWFAPVRSIFGKDFSRKEAENLIDDIKDIFVMNESSIMRQLLDGYIYSWCTEYKKQITANIKGNNRCKFDDKEKSELNNLKSLKKDLESITI